MYNTPFDDAYKTIQEKIPQLLIPLVNEQFQTNYEFGEPIINLGMESHTREGTIVADSVFRIGTRTYHVECQSNPDGTIAIRMLEYDFYIALKDARKGRDGVYHVQMPGSGILYLRHNQDTPDEVVTELEMADGTKIRYRVPIIKVQDYSLEDIFEKNLFIMLPFYIMRYEQERDTLEEGGPQLEQLALEYEKIIEYCENFVFMQGTEGTRIVAELEIIMKRISDYIFRNHSLAQLRIGGIIMGGTAWKTLGEEMEELREDIAELERDKQELEQDNKEKGRSVRILKLLLSGKDKEEVAQMESVSMEELEELIK